MPKLPRPLSPQAIEINGMISQGRADDALDHLVRVLGDGSADVGVQMLAAKWIATVGLPAGAAKALRGGKPAFPKEWPAIKDMIEDLTITRSKQQAVADTAAYFGCSERHIYNCLEWYESARDE
jgi:hypothetical protein